MNEAMLLWGLALIAVALFLIVVEVFVPSGGLIAVASAGCAIAGVVCLFRYSTSWGLTGVLILFVAGPAAFGFALKVWPSTAIGRKMLGERSPEELEAERLREARELEERQALVGARGTAVTVLRPVGIVQIDGVRIDAIADGAFIPAGAPVRVTYADLTQVKVRQVV